MICVDGSLLPAFLIWKAQCYQEGWYQISKQNEGLCGYMYATSPSGWTDNSLGLHYIEYYNKHTRHLVEDSDGKIQQYCMLLMDNHSSHLTWQFVEYVLVNKIVLVALPPHLTHKL